MAEGACPAGVLVTPLRRIEVPGGDVLHAVKASAPGYAGFGEAYFTTLKPGVTKGWKRHREMTMNLVVVAGMVEFVLVDDRKGTPEKRMRWSVVLSPDCDELYRRLTVPPGLWMAFGSRATTPSMVLNLADIEHRPDEADSLPLDAFGWDQDAG